MLSKMFQFPSNGKAHSDPLSLPNSPHIGVLFQFPSNGKAHSDTKISHDKAVGVSFNSLQTGRHIQTQW